MTSHQTRNPLCGFLAGALGVSGIKNNNYGTSN